MKIVQALRLKKIPANVISLGLEAIDESEYLSILSGLIEQKKLESLINLIDVFCDKRQFRRAAFGDDLQVPESYFDKLLDKVKSEYVL